MSPPNIWRAAPVSYSGVMDYNEIPVEGRHWNAHLPTTIEAFFGGAKARAARAEFIERFGLDPHEYPLLTFDRDNWEAPFALATLGLGLGAE